MDISTLAIPDTAEVHLEFPGIGKLYADDKKTQKVAITVYGPSSDAAVAHKRKMVQQAQQKIAKKGIKGLASGDIEESDIDRLCALTADVENLVYEGEKITAKTIRKVYSDPKMGWIKEQVAEKVGSWEDFLL